MTDDTIPYALSRVPIPMVNKVASMDAETTARELAFALAAVDEDDPATLIWCALLCNRAAVYARMRRGEG